MASGYVVCKNQYYDSVFLMGVSNRLSKIEGVRQVAALMGSEKNKQLLAEIGIYGEGIDSAQPNDLIVAIIADQHLLIDDILANVNQILQSQLESEPLSNIHTIEEAFSEKRSANLAVFSIPGEYAFREAMKALEGNLNVFIFSSNVPIEEELKLKQFATERDLLVMGPDCGTSILGGVGIGFANIVRKGSIGVIGPSGTGLQEFTSQVHNAGYGISHAIGTGSHDLSNEIGGITTVMALEALEADAQTKVIAIIAKPPGQKTLHKLVAHLMKCSKPILACFLGLAYEHPNNDSKIIWTHTIDEAVQAAIHIVSNGEDSLRIQLSNDELEHARKIREKWSAEQCHLRGLFAGGTFCYQSQQILLDHGINVFSNAPIKIDHKLPNSEQSYQHTIIDMGDDAYTLGRPHPMIDGTIRRNRILKESQDASVAIILLDFILGYNASSDPVGDILDVILEAKQTSQANSRNLTFVASICGTQDDLQEIELQTKLLNDAGVIVFNSNAKASLFCCELLKESMEA